ncbi:hypothetical protein [Niabella ginsengisoli]|uniref:Gfo/Idh/MocA-like oxidoreductase N-terminal domain-containing protein n=1 Tax=Niabella ginsengisoli TaxID=522298 RepID=A0ABS9SP84_9BACT|nr:hypothetical protein [Niabella ginsengisoli]MCH5599974.1 hypothetical protein [Niabella ginsengisoli]
MQSRKRFLANASALAVGGFALQSFNTKNFSRFATSAAEEINVGAIGINGMGWSNTMSILKIPGVRLAALCDVDKNVLDKRLAELKKKILIHQKSKHIAIIVVCWIIKMWMLSSLVRPIIGTR